MLCLSTPWRKGWLRAAAAEIRREGSRVSILSMRSSGASGIRLREGEKTIVKTELSSIVRHRTAIAAHYQHTHRSPPITCILCTYSTDV